MVVRTVILGPPPPEVEALIAQRQKLGLDKCDEVWEGDYHMNPAPAGPHAWLQSQLTVMLIELASPLRLYASAGFNVGELGNFRVPDLGLHRGPPLATWFPTAALVVEVESPGDETWQKFGFYADHGVDEILVASPERRSLAWFVLVAGRYEPRPQSALLGPATADWPDRLEWPPAPG